MMKKLKVRAIVALICSAILFAMPIGALFMNDSMTRTVNAADTDTEEVIVDTSEENNNESVSDNDIEDDEDNPDDTAEPVCTCISHCSSNYDYDASCEVCKADFHNCEYQEPNVSITITAPERWQNESAEVHISVRDIKNTGNFEIAKIEARIGMNGSWQDITDERYIEISENCSVYVQVTDQNGYVYSKNKNIYCFDRVKPTLNAAVSNGLLSVQAHDTDSGVKIIYVNGYEFTDITNGTLNIRLQQFDAGYEYFSIQAMDNAGNMSEVYLTKNPYYDDNPEDDNDHGASTLPPDATPSAPSSATGVVTEHTQTDAEGRTTNSSNHEAEKRASMEEADRAEREEQGEEEEEQTGREFYTIQTANDKVFYLIIDNNGESEMVYFLTEISENDLLNVTQNSNEVLPQNSAALESAIPTTDTAMPNNNVEESDVSVTKPADTEIQEELPEELPEEPVEEPQKESQLGTYLVLGVFGAIAIAAWFFLKKKSKKEDFIDEEDEEDEEEEYYESDDEGTVTGEDDFFNNTDIEDVAETIEDEE